jgi:hypothetical protein
VVFVEDTSMRIQQMRRRGRGARSQQLSSVAEET